MSASGLRNLFRRYATTPPEAAVSADATPSPETAPGAPPPAAVEPRPWRPERIAAAAVLWGEGFLRPGGAGETLHMVRAFGATPAETVLLLGGQAGGPARAIAEAFGCYVSSFEADADLAASAERHLAEARLGKRATLQRWDPRVPAFRRHAYNHAVLFEPLRGAAPEPLIGELAAAIRPGGQLALVELVTDRALDPADPVAAGWCRLEHRSPLLPSEAAITACLAVSGFDVRVTEDVTLKHKQLAMAGWETVVQAMRVNRPGHGRAAALVAEAETWLFRLRLFASGRLRLVRWHAIRAR